jgi:GNAT superfamily N-acetyltransferase
METPSPFPLSTEGIRLLPVQSVEDARQFLGLRGIRLDSLPAPHKTVEILVNRKHCYLVHEGEDGPLVGTASLAEKEPGVGLVGIWVDPRRRSQGWGSCILKALEQVAGQAGYYVVQAEPLSIDKAAIAFFEKRGYYTASRLIKGL